MKQVRVELLACHSGDGEHTGEEAGTRNWLGGGEEGFPIVLDLELLLGGDNIGTWSERMSSHEHLFQKFKNYFWEQKRRGSWLPIVLILEVVLKWTRHLASESTVIFVSCHLILFVSSTNYFQIVRRRCCLKSWEVHLLCKLQGVHFAQGTNVWFVCTEMAKIWCNVFSPQTPFGGFKQSGQGRDLGPEGVKEYLECKTVTIALDLKTS